MTFAKSCPGARTIREPIPEFFNCANCGHEVEIWTDELKATCPKCGTKVFRERGPSCIDWCPYAKECVGPEVYQRLKPGAGESLAEADTPLDILRREHERILEALGLLRGATLCLKLSTLTPDSLVRERGVSHFAKVMEFFDKDVGWHFWREEGVLFPTLEKYIAGGKSPTHLLLAEHTEIWKWHDQLKKKLDEIQGKFSEAIPAEVQAISRQLERLLREHIKKENEMLLPLARSLLSKEELDDFSRKWQELKRLKAGYR